MSVKERVKSGLIRMGVQAANYAFILILALLVGAVVILVSGKNPIDAYIALFRGAFGSFIKSFSPYLVFTSFRLMK